MRRLQYRLKEAERRNLDCVSSLRLSGERRRVVTDSAIWAEAFLQRSGETSPTPDLEIARRTVRSRAFSCRQPSFIDWNWHAHLIVIPLGSPNLEFATLAKQTIRRHLRTPNAKGTHRSDASTEAARWGKITNGIRRPELWRPLGTAGFETANGNPIQNAHLPVERHREHLTPMKRAAPR